MPPLEIPIAFSGNPLWRLAEKRDENSLASALAHPGARFICFLESKPVIQRNSDDAVTCLFSRAEISPLSPRWDEAALLGFLDGAPHIAVTAPGEADRLPAPFDTSDIRPLFAAQLVSAPILGKAHFDGYLSTNRACRRVLFERKRCPISNPVQLPKGYQNDSTSKK